MEVDLHNLSIGRSETMEPSPQKGSNSPLVTRQPEPHMPIAEPRHHTLEEGYGETGGFMLEHQILKIGFKSTNSN